MKNSTFVGALGLAALIASSGAGFADPIKDPSGDPTPAKHENGRYYDKAGNPTFKIQTDGTVDWATYSGFRRYHSECHVCHGPNAAGSSYAPALKDSLKRLSYAEVYGIIVGGKRDLDAGQEKVMPSFADNKNVMCYIDDIYTYIRARADGVLPEGRPPKHEDKEDISSKNEDACFAQK